MSDIKDLVDQIKTLRTSQDDPESLADLEEELALSLEELDILTGLSKGMIFLNDRVFHFDTGSKSLNYVEVKQLKIGSPTLALQAQTTDSITLDIVDYGFVGGYTEVIDYVTYKKSLNRFFNDVEEVEVNSGTEAVFDSLVPGEYYFSVTIKMVDGLKSLPSNVVKVTL